MVVILALWNCRPLYCHVQKEDWVIAKPTMAGLTKTEPIMSPIRHFHLHVKMSELSHTHSPNESFPILLFNWKPLEYVCHLLFFERVTHCIVIIWFTLQTFDLSQEQRNWHVISKDIIVWSNIGAKSLLKWMLLFKALTQILEIAKRKYNGMFLLQNPEY